MNTKIDELDTICRTCEHAEILVEDGIVLCEKKGIVPADGICRKFVYDPLKHVPPKNAPAPKLEYVNIDDVKADGKAD